MAESFWFDAKALSNDDLFTKQIELVRRKTLAARLGRGDAVAQLDIMIQSIDLERRERMYLERWNTQPASPVVLETDPELREQEPAVEAPSLNNRPNRPARRAIRSAVPYSTDGV